jgi:hypothetical protein
MITVLPENDALRVGCKTARHIRGLVCAGIIALMAATMPVTFEGWRQPVAMQAAHAQSAGVPGTFGNPGIGGIPRGTALNPGTLGIPGAHVNPGTAGTPGGIINPGIAGGTNGVGLRGLVGSPNGLGNPFASGDPNGLGNPNGLFGAGLGTPDTIASPPGSTFSTFNRPGSLSSFGSQATSGGFGFGSPNNLSTFGSPGSLSMPGSLSSPGGVGGPTGIGSSSVGSTGAGATGFGSSSTFGQ